MSWQSFTTDAFTIYPLTTIYTVDLTSADGAGSGDAGDLVYVVGLANALAEATIDFTIRDPDHADAHGRAGFDALWRMIA